MKTLHPALTGLAIALLAAACGDGKKADPHESRKIKMDSFAVVCVTGPVKVNYTEVQGRIYGELYYPGHLDELNPPVVRGDTLFVSQQSITRRIKPDRLPVINLYGPPVRRFEAGGHARLTVNSLSAEENLDIVLTGPGDIDLYDIYAPARLSLYGRGSGDINLKQANCEELKAVLTGSGDIDISHTGCSTADVSLTGSGDMELKNLTSRQVRALQAGTGDMELKGRCLTAHLAVRSTGDLDAAELAADTVYARSSGKGDLRCNASGLLRTQTQSSSIIEYAGQPQIEATGRKPRRYR